MSLLGRGNGGKRRRSTPPPNQRMDLRKIYVAGKPVPAHANATRFEHARSLLGSRKYIWRYAIFGGVLFLAAAATGRALIAGIALAVAVVGVSALLFREATTHAHKDFFTGFALKHGFTYSDRMSLMETTPLLGAGDRRHCEHYMEGQLKSTGQVAGLSHYVFETREQRRDRRNRAISIYTPHWYTICVVDLPRAISAFPGVYLTRRGGLLGRDAWLDRPGMQSVELESAMLANKYELLTRNSQDRTRLMELFSPSFQMWLVSLPIQIFFEYNGGTLVVYVPGKQRSVESLETMLLAAERITSQIMREGEPLHVVSASVPPPGASGEVDRDHFPPPPPATKPQIEIVPDAPITSRFGSSSVPPPGA